MLIKKTMDNAPFNVSMHEQKLTDGSKTYSVLFEVPNTTPMQYMIYDCVDQGDAGKLYELLSFGIVAATLNRA